MKEYAEAFYKSTEWKNCRKEYVKSVGGLCENCLKKGVYKPAIIVHHIEHITPQNIDNPEITLNYANLLAVCRDCHGELHAKKKRYYTDPDTGEVIIYGDQSKHNRTGI